jgi:hypothetical protein
MPEKKIKKPKQENKTNEQETKNETKPVSKKEGISAIWERIEFPFYTLLGWSVLSTYLTGAKIVSNLFILSLANWAVMLGAFGYVGYQTMRDSKTIGFAAKHGAILGAITGFVSAGITIFSFHYYPHIFADALNNMIQQGLSAEQAKQYFQIGLYVGFITGPLFSSLIGAGISALGAFVFKK